MNSLVDRGQPNWTQHRSYVTYRWWYYQTKQLPCWNLEIAENYRNMKCCRQCEPLDRISWKWLWCVYTYEYEQRVPTSVQVMRMMQNRNRLETQSSHNVFTQVRSLIELTDLLVCHIWIIPVWYIWSAVSGIIANDHTMEGGGRRGRIHRQTTRQEECGNRATMWRLFKL